MQRSSSVHKSRNVADPFAQPFLLRDTDTNITIDIDDNEMIIAHKEPPKLPTPNFGSKNRKVIKIPQTDVDSKENMKSHESLLDQYLKQEK